MPALDRPVVKPRPVYLDLVAIRQPLPAMFAETSTRVWSVLRDWLANYFPVMR